MYFQGNSATLPERKLQQERKQAYKQMVKIQKRKGYDGHGVLYRSIESAFSTLQTFKLIKKEKLKINNLALKKGISCFYSVCMFLFVCYFIGLRH